MRGTLEEMEPRPGCSSCIQNEIPNAKKIRSRRFEITPILDFEVRSEELRLVEYWVLSLFNRKAIGAVLNILPQLPMSANHLKRIKDGSILIQPSVIPLSEELLAKISGAVGDSSKITTVMVPSTKPFTRQQFEWAKQRWPTAFHPNKEVEALLDGSFFSEVERNKIIEFFLEAERVSKGDQGCVIVDVNGKIVARSRNRAELLGHAVMCAISGLCKSKQMGNTDVLQYIGTGFDVFLTEEPCAMCAMALVHFRVRRIFFGRRNPRGGALESCWRIQEDKRINHHYQVFRIDEVL